jgi:benzoate/toluate 1,2-dioxygenase reductase subunit
MENVSVNVVKLDLGVRGDADAWPSFMPGQYVNIGIPDAGQNRSYSFANSPGARERLTFYIKILESGVMSDFLRGRAKQGDLVNIEGPFGHFYLRGQERPILMMAGGTGLAPMLSMLDQMASIETCRKPVHLLYGVNNADEFFGIRQIESYASKGIDLTYETISLNGSADWDGRSGHVTELLNEKLVRDNPEIYLCGPPPMIDAANAWFEKIGIDQNFVYSEKFVPS